MNRRPPLIGIDASRAATRAPTGTEAYSYHLIRALAPLLAPRHRVRLYFRESPDSSRAMKGAWAQGLAAHAEARTMPFPRAWTHLRLSWEMLRHPPDLLFVPAHVLPLARPARTLVTVHDLGYRHYPEAHPFVQRRYLELSTRWNVRVASHILADSEATRAAILSTYHVKADRVTVVYPGYEPDLAPVRDPEAIEATKHRYGIHGPYILFVGRIQPRKNLTRLIEAFAGLLPHHPEISLVLAGPTGWLSEEIEARAQAEDVRGSVLFTGYIAPEDKAALISGARLFAYPSLYEGFGFPALEAQACGTPLLTSTTSSLPEVAGEGALLVDPEDVAALTAGLGQLLDDEALRKELIKLGYENLRRFSWRAAAEQTMDIIAKLLQT
ncbi:MAG: glycosyltransferase family 4 protein [Anaerolineae bacterium]